MSENPATPNDSTRLTRAVNSLEVALEGTVRDALIAAGWTAAQQTHLLDTLLMVHRYGREVAP